MDKLYRKISLEQAKNRNFNALPYYALIDVSGETHCVLEDNRQPWGCYTVDILIPITGNKCVSGDDHEEPCIPEITLINEIHDTIGLTEVDVYDEEENCNRPMLWARYKNLMLLYYWIINKFVPSITYYRFCKSGFVQLKPKTLSYFLENDIKIFPDLDSIEEERIEIGEIIGITDLYKEAIKRFKEINNIKGFIGFIKRLLTEGLFSPLSGTTPYLDVEFSITSDKVDLGLMSPIPEQWIPKKKYYLGDAILYNSESYYLFHCDETYDLIEVSGQLLKDIINSIELGNNSYAYVDSLDNIPNSAFNMYNYIHEFQRLNKGVTPINYTQYVYRVAQAHAYNGYLYYLIKPYYTGSYDEITKITSFDSSDGTHWKKIDLNVLLTVDYDKVYTGVTESKLITLKRQKTPVDDHGVKLPFVPKYESGVTLSGDTELQYLVGITDENMYDDGTWICDDLVSISKIITASGETYKEEINPGDGGVITSDQFDDIGTVEFVYYIGATLDIDSTESGVTKTRVEKTGVKYTEQWNYEKKTINFEVDGASNDFTYILFYPTDNGETSKSNLDLNGKTPIYSIIEYYDKQAKEVSVLLMNSYKDEDLLGVQNINDLEYDMHTGRFHKAIDAYIERGKSASFERHNILGEIKTFSDLENYRNNFFQI